MRKLQKLILGAALALGLSVGISVVTYAGTYAVVTGSVVNVRAYGEISDENRLFQVSRGETIEIHGICGDFFRATIAGTSNVYISREFVRIRETRGTVGVSTALVYNKPIQMGGTPKVMLNEGDTVTVTSTFENWYGIRINNVTAFVEAAYVSIPYFVYNLPTARIGSTLADEIVATAKTYLGARYLWGGTTPNGFDCSGFMVYLFSPHGITLNRHSADMARNGVYVPRSELMPADLVFFNNGSGRISHVGMYIGDGYFIHSSSARTGVIISSMYSNFNARGFVTARRVLPE
ncbi:MAG: C40 family peptidase [Defluviitaleaceae bacterium]|nr:C40 family peptidase [Defluviitaleaceae bacterium]